jgi:hypothetical protein
MAFTDLLHVATKLSSEGLHPIPMGTIEMLSYVCGQDLDSFESRRRRYHCSFGEPAACGCTGLLKPQFRAVIQAFNNAHLWYAVLDDRMAHPIVPYTFATTQMGSNWFLLYIHLSITRLVRFCKLRAFLASFVVVSINLAHVLALSVVWRPQK